MRGFLLSNWLEFGGVLSTGRSMRGTHQSAPRFYNPGPSWQRCPQATWPWTAILLAEQSAVSFVPVRKRRGSVSALPPTAGQSFPTVPREASQLPSNRTTKHAENHTIKDGLQLRNQLPLSSHNNQLLPQIPPSLGASMVPLPVRMAENLPKLTQPVTKEPI